MEELCIVDRDNKVIGKDTIDNIRKNNSIRRIVHVVIFNSKGQIIAQLRSHLKKIKPLMWTSSASGKLRYGEEPIDGAARELEEEIGITTDLTQVDEPFYHEESDLKAFYYVFKGYYNGSCVIDDAEVEKVDWFFPSDLFDNPNITPGLTEVLELLGEHNLL